MISVLILTKNEEQDLPACLASVAWCDDVHVLDSFSQDGTVALAQAAGATVTQRAFDNWAAHQNWALRHLPFRHPWVLYLDADERVSEGLRQALLAFQPAPALGACSVQRRDFAWDGTWLRHAQISPYFTRLFRPERVRYERAVNPVAVVEGAVQHLPGYLDHYPFSKGIRAWVQRHIGYAELEAHIKVQQADEQRQFSWRTALLGADFAQRRYHQKGLFYKLPARPLVKWLYMVLGRGAFLDGPAGLTYATLQAIYEYFIVLKTKELTWQEKQQNVSA